MLLERKELTENELKKAYKEASSLYLLIAVHGQQGLDSEYENLRKKISDLEHDLNLINILIQEGKV